MYEYSEILLDRVKPGMFIEFDLAWLKNPFYSNSFRINSVKEIDMLARAGVKKVKFFPGRSTASFSETVNRTSGPRVHAHRSVPIAPPSLESFESRKKRQYLELQRKQEKLEMLEREYKNVFRRISGIVAVLQSDVQSGVEATQEFLSETIKSLAQEMEFLVNMVTSEMSKEHFNTLHQLNVCYLSLFLGKAMGLSLMQLYELGMAAFLHDIGKVKIPRQIVMKHPPYTPAEKQYLELHPQYAVEILGSVKGISKNVLDAIYQHHEMGNGTGYPLKKTHQDISLVAKIIAVVNTYDNICNHYYLRRLLTPHESLSYMYTRLNECLSMDIIVTFIKTVGVFPAGCLVELSDGNLGMVISTNQAQSTHPTIILYSESTPREKPLIIDMSEMEDLSIVRSIRPEEAPEEVVSYLRVGNRAGMFLGSINSK